MFILRFVVKVLVVLCIILLSGLCLGVKVFENVGSRLAGIALTLLGIMAILALLTADWFALTVFGVLASCCIIPLFGLVTLEVVLEEGRDALKERF